MRFLLGFVVVSWVCNPIYRKLQKGWNMGLKGFMLDFFFP